jgi:ribonuclease G
MSQKLPKREILISRTPYEKRIAVIENGELMELVVEGLESNRVLGNIYKGVVQKVLPGLKAAFVDIGLDKAGFLHQDDVVDRNLSLQAEYGEDEDGNSAPVEIPTIDQMLKEGQEIMVQVTKEPISTKGARLTTHLIFPGRFLVCMPGTDFVGVSKKERDHQKRRALKRAVQSLKAEGVGYIVRTNGLNETENELRDQMEDLASKWEMTQENFRSLPSRTVIYEESNSAEATLRDYFSDNTDFVYIDDRVEFKAMKNYLKKLSPDKLDKVKLWSDSNSLFDQFKIEDEYEKTLQRQVPLRRGGYLIIEQTEALVSIDINSGSKVHGSDQAKNILETNLDACEEIAKQLRLRDMGGLVVIDFIDMDSEDDREKVTEAFKKAIKKDKAPISFIPLSPFCLMEVTRKRVRQNLLTSKTHVCPACNGRGYLYSPETVLSQMDRWLGRAAKKRAPRKLMLVVSHLLTHLLLDNRGLFLKYLEDKHRFQLELVEDPEGFENSWDFYDAASGECLTEQFTLGH